MSRKTRSGDLVWPTPGLGRRLVARVVAPLALLMCFTGLSGAANVEIADTPMATGSSLQIKPNIMFVLDDSGTMARSYIPDAVNRFPNGAYGYASAACNGMYYNPSITYAPPVRADGSSYPAAPFGAAPRDGFDPNAPTVDLATQFRAYDSGCDSEVGGLCDSAQAAYYYQYEKPNNGADPLDYVYSATGQLDTTKGIFPACNAMVGTAPWRNSFTKKTSAAADFNRQNFANWYSYYRTRMNAMKSAAGRAFSQLPNPDGLRIGFSTHSEPGVSATDNENFHPIGDFCGVGSLACQPDAQRSELFRKLYGATAVPGVETPLRSSMAKIGRMYAGFHAGSRLSASDDPIQYSCQQNFLIMATDGAWNQDTNAFFNITNNAGVGDQDGSAPRPMFDALSVPNTLADIAMYYYETDLRDNSLGNCTGALGQDVCTNDVSGAGRDNKMSQHMTTFTLGFGIDGSLRYAENYESGGAGDFNAILNGSKNWPDPRPTDAGDNFFRVDDLWHAAVNGRGAYYSAKTPDSLIGGLSRAMGTAVARTGAGSGSATSNLEPVAGDNFAYVASYRTQHWDGDLQARTIDLVTGALAPEQDRAWSAKEKLAQLVVGNGWTTRTVYMKGSGTTRVAFNPTNVRANHQGLPAELTDDVINFIRGDASKEDQEGNAVRSLRDRTHVLGDIVSSHPVYVRRPPFKYTDSGYEAFALAKAGRTGIVLVGANDGMLHAFNAQTGVESWAYVPGAVIPNLHKLADRDYGRSVAKPHQYYVDGAITVGDICVANNCANAGATDWRTIAVVGLGKGGRSYFALDITDTTNPAILWEFTAQDDADLGLSFGNPIITKQAGRWVVVFASGYNNASPGDGKGRLFVLDAGTGAKLSEIIAGTDTDPSTSGISEISNWVNNIRLDDTTQYVYGGDLYGRLWRFDISAGQATLLASFGSTQPITTRPELAEVKAGDGSLKRVVFVGTGRYLGVGDLSNTDLQSIYAVRETLDVTGWGDFRAADGVVEQVLSASGTTRKITSNAVDWTTSPGWFVDLDAEQGERVTVDFKLVNGVLTVVTNVPDTGTCVVGGRSYIYFFDNRTGSYVQTVDGGFVGRLLSQSLAVGLSVIRVAGRDVAIVNTSDNRQISVPVPAYSASGSFRRMMWRELVN